MEPTIQGRVYKFGDNVNSDIIIPGRYLIYIDRERLAQHAFEVLGEGFPAKLREFQRLLSPLGDQRSDAARPCQVPRSSPPNALRRSDHSGVRAGSEIRRTRARAGARAC